ncbi:heavy metal translocating P-type ATPase [Luteimicrobium album]|nr:heavy metal translocating P-type ATPase [Luteimicrobium album]
MPPATRHPSTGNLLGQLRRYPLVAATVVVGLVTAGLWLAGAGDAARWLGSGFALLVAARQAWDMVRDLLHGTVGLDVLAVIAIVSTVVVGDWAAALVVVLMLTGGEALEDYAGARASAELEALLAGAPQDATLDDGGALRRVPAAEVRVGDVVVVRPGEVVPVDGTLVSASGVFDESSLTGEPLPVTRAAGDGVLSGSVVGADLVRVRATATAARSQYQQIVDLVRGAAESRPEFVRLADRWSVPFTAVSLLIAGVAWAASGDPVRFAEVLVLATPCPLLIAAPVAFLSGTNRATRHGIIVKTAATLERLARVRTVALDKTGTLTRGAPEVVRVVPAAGRSEDDVLDLAASAEQASAHVLAHAVVTAARERGLAPSSAGRVREVVGSGVEALVHDAGTQRSVVVGKAAYVGSVAPDASAPELAPGELAVLVAVDGAYAGAVVLADAVRPDAAGTVRDLRAGGVGHVMMLTGDGEVTARHVAAEVGIDDVRAGLLPAEKVAAVSSAEPRPVLMVGDGVNDAPVLAAADVGVAMGARGSTAASQSADVVLLHDRVSDVARAARIARDTVLVAKQSIWLGIGLSVVLMLVAAFGVIPAVIGALVQEAVDLVAILNGLRARGRADEVRLPTSSAERPAPAYVPRQPATLAK